MNSYQRRFVFFISIQLIVGIHTSKDSKSLNPSINGEVDDFREWLEEKIKLREVILVDNNSLPPSDIAAPEYNNFENLKASAEDDTDYPAVLEDSEDGDKEAFGTKYSTVPELDFYHAVESLSGRGEQSHGSLENNEMTSSNDQISIESAMPNVQQSNDRMMSNMGEPYEEILYVRRGNSNVPDPIPELLKRLIQETDTDLKKPKETQNEINSCPSTYFESKDHICSSGSQYLVEEYNTTLYSEQLYALMKSKTVSLPPEDSMCNFGKNMGPDRGVNERALCPFEWTISERNRNRIPEYLFSANCSCQVSRRGVFSGAVCVPLKAKVPVLWRVECHEGSYKYQEGWEEVNVACVPVGRLVTHSRYAPGFKVKSPFD